MYNFCVNDLEKRIEKIEQRNKAVEINKAWEASKTRKFFVSLFTYLSISLYFTVIGVDKPFVNAVVPTIGFLLSTLSLPFIRRFWEKNR